MSICPTTLSLTLHSTTPPSICGANPSYLALDDSKSLLFAANETSDGHLSCLSVTHTRSLSLVWRVRCGTLPAHVSVTPRSEVVVGCFGDGTVRGFSFSGLARWTVRVGAGVHYAAAVRGDHILACAAVAGVLGTIRDGQLAETRDMRGLYPRHAAVDGPATWVGCVATGQLVRVDARADGVTVATDGKLGAVKSDGTAGIFGTERCQGRHGRVWWMDENSNVVRGSSGGLTPRDVEMVARDALVVANQDSGNVCVLRKETAEIQVIDALQVTGSPACVVAVHPARP